MTGFSIMQSSFNVVTNSWLKTPWGQVLSWYIMLKSYKTKKVSNIINLLFLEPRSWIVQGCSNTSNSLVRFIFPANLRENSFISAAIYFTVQFSIMSNSLYFAKNFQRINGLISTGVLSHGVLSTIFRSYRFRISMKTSVFANLSVSLVFTNYNV